MWVNGVLVVNNDGSHPGQERSGNITLNAGLIPIILDYCQGTGGYELSAAYQGPR